MAIPAAAYYFCNAAAAKLLEFGGKVQTGAV